MVPGEIPGAAFSSELGVLYTCLLFVEGSSKAGRCDTGASCNVDAGSGEFAAGGRS